MLQIRKDLCLGCGLCISNCPLQAISLLWDCAVIDQSRCNSCYLCVGVCPQDAIIDNVLVSKDALKTTVAILKQRADDLIERIEGMRR